jgi:hypothetical protein
MSTLKSSQPLSTTLKRNPPERVIPCLPTVITLNFIEGTRKILDFCLRRGFGLYVYLFEEGNTKLRGLLGGKGADLAEMTRLGLLVPPGLTVTTEACNYYGSHGLSFLTDYSSRSSRNCMSQNPRLARSLETPLIHS